MLEKGACAFCGGGFRLAGSRFDRYQPQTSVHSLWIQNNIGYPQGVYDGNHSSFDILN